MGDRDLTKSVQSAQMIADMQPSRTVQSADTQPARTVQLSQFSLPASCDPAIPNSSRISSEDLKVMREKFPQLNDFSEQFLQSRTLEELLRIESTSLRIRDSEKARETEERLAQNKSGLASKFYDVPAGKDNRWSELHPARFLPGMACTATKQFKTAREVIGLTSPPAVACYDMTSIGMGGFVTPKGWMEIGNMASTKLRVSMFNINNAAKSSSSKTGDSDDSCEMKSVDEFELALRTMRCAAHFSTNWNYSFVALENFLWNRKYCKEELKFDPNPARTLCQFVDFILSENSNHWRDGESFLTTGELSAYWDNFIGARPHLKSQPSQPQSSGSNTKSSQGGQKQQKRKFPPSDICHKWNVGKCNKAAGTCVNFNGQALKHICNWRDLSVANSPPCGQQHTRRGNH